jgi:hypothetical protein
MWAINQQGFIRMFFLSKLIFTPMKNRYIATFILSLSTFVVSAQLANSWIDYNQRYFKIPVVKNGLYEISAAQLAAAGVPISAIPPERFQIFRRGQELAIKVDKSASNVVTAITFYGLKNDGKGDTELYRTPESQPHTLYNLYTDTAAYFLTWKLTGTGKRMTNKTLLTPDTPEQYQMAEPMSLQVTQYSDGRKYGYGNDLSSGIFDEGEGWFGSRTTKTGKLNFTFNLTNAKTDVGIKPKYEILIVGNNNLPHRTEILLGPSSSSLDSVAIAEGYTNFQSKLITGEFEWSDLSGTGQIVVQVHVLGFPDVADAQAVAYVKIIYPQTFNLLATENKTFTLRTTTADRLYVTIPTTNSATKIYDITDPLNPITRQVSATSGSVSLSVDNVTESRKLHAVSAPLSSPALAEQTFQPIGLSGKNYLIISHRDLMQNASDGKDPVKAYADYRASSYSVATVEIHDIYNQYNYGDPSALAIRNFLKHAIAVGNPKYLFLIGKTSTVDNAYYRTAPGIAIPMLVPTFGKPGTDALFSVGLTKNDFVQEISTGRLSAYKSEEVKNYLDKVKEMEALPYDALWRKHIMQLSGGQNVIELSTYAAYINAFSNVAESDFLGGKTFNKNKESSGLDYINVNEEINKGVSMITFFGHSSSSVNDIEIGRPTAAAGYSNKGKYPVILMNGCNGGAIFSKTLSFGEEWMAAKDLGAVSVIAHADFAISSNLKRYSDLFYQFAFATEDSFGLSLGELMIKTQRQYFLSYGSIDENLSNVYGTLLQGDPAYKIFAPNQTDYAIQADEVFALPIESERIASTSAKFSLNFVVRNFGKTTKDSLSVKVKRTFADGTEVDYVKKFQRPLYMDTLSFEIVNDQALNNAGDNFFSISIDPDDDVDEFNELNNAVNFELYVPRGSTVHLQPQDFGVTDSKIIKFVWQSADMLSQSRAYSFECDTTSTFTSGFKIADQLSGKLLLTKSIDFNNIPDSTTIYWRTRLSDPLPGEDNNWITSSFTFINAQQSGWAQVAEKQILQNIITGMDFDETTKKWAFKETTLPVEIANHGRKNVNGFRYGDIKVSINGENLMLATAPADSMCIVNTFNAVVFDKETAAPIRPLGISGPDVTNKLVCGKLPQMIHNFTSTDILGSSRYLDLLITKMSDGDAILLFSFDSVTYSQWDAQVKASLAKVGISAATISSLVDGQPAIFLGKKGLAEGQAVSLLDNGSGLPRGKQALNFKGNVTGVFSSAKIQSAKIGPAKSWNQLQLDVANQGADEIELTISGKDISNQSKILITTNAEGTLDLSQFDANQYPYLDLALSIKDNDNLKPTVLSTWSVDFEKPADGILLTDEYTTKSLDEGADYQETLHFYNYSEKDFSDSLTVNFRFGNTSNGYGSNQIMIAPIKALDTATFTATFSTVGKAGQNNLITEVKANETEQYLLNNSVTLARVADVVADNTNPVLDVTFDGSYILNGDIVSPNPRILVKFKDNNPYLYKKDTAGLDLMLKAPCEGCDFERVTLANDKVVYTLATENNDFSIDYKPGPLTDGIYQLKVQGKDASGNQSGTEPYQVSFEVISESSITHFYPYPNPFSTSTRFVFTLTGSEIPDQIKIQIMTVSGRVVREITDIGPLKIGNNISQYAWDGRDEFGDLLANGVYLYKVFVNKGGQPIKSRNTSADRAFKHDFGKMYILR